MKQGFSITKTHLKTNETNMASKCKTSEVIFNLGKRQIEEESFDT